MAKGDWRYDPVLEHEACRSPACAAGTMYVQADDACGIKSGEAIPFNRMAEIPLKLEEALAEHGVALNIGEPASKLYTS